MWIFPSNCLIVNPLILLRTESLLMQTKPFCADWLYWAFHHYPVINSHWEGVILAGNVFIIYIKTIRILRIFRGEGNIIQLALRGVYTCTQSYGVQLGPQTIGVMMPVIWAFVFTFQAGSQGKRHQWSGIIKWLIVSLEPHYCWIIFIKTLMIKTRSWLFYQIMFSLVFLFCWSNLGSLIVEGLLQWWGWLKLCQWGIIIMTKLQLSNFWFGNDCGLNGSVGCLTGYGGI